MSTVLLLSPYMIIIILLVIVLPTKGAVEKGSGEYTFTDKL
jgi:hypothetical protein